MASSNYTSNLHLSAWSESDRPKRADFVSDNSIIDRELGGHLANTAMHLTAAEKAKLGEPFTVQLYAGSGASSRDISLGFQPKLVIIYKRGVPPVVLKNGGTTVNSAVGAYGHGYTTGIVVTSTGVTVCESAQNSDGVAVSLNESGSQYTLIAFK